MRESERLQLKLEIYQELYAANGDFYRLLEHTTEALKEALDQENFHDERLANIGGDLG